MFQLRRKLNNWCAPHSRIFIGNLVVIHLVKNFLLFKESNTSPSSKIPANVHYPEPVQSSLYLWMLFLRESFLILPHIPTCLKWLFQLKLSGKILYWYTFLQYVKYVMTPHPSWFNHPNNIKWNAQIMKLSFYTVLIALLLLISLSSKQLPQHCVLRYPQIHVLPLEWELKSITHTKHQLVLHDTCFIHSEGQFWTQDPLHKRLAAVRWWNPGEWNHNHSTPYCASPPTGISYSRVLQFTLHP